MDEIRNLKEITSYFPYNVKIKTARGIMIVKGIDTVNDVIIIKCWFNKLAKTYFLEDCKFLLRPLNTADNFFKDKWEEDIDVRTFYNDEFLAEHGIEHFDDILKIKKEWLPLGLVELFYKYHFDIDGLIEKGLAENIND